MIQTSEVLRAPDEPVSAACLHCGETSLPIAPHSRICLRCWQVPGRAVDYIFRDLPVDMASCPFPPGSPEKVAFMAQRAAQGYAVCSPFDEQDHERSRPGALQPKTQEVFALPRLRIKGVDKTGNLYRARPMWDGRRYSLGLYHTYEEAAAVCRRWWQQTLGLFWEFGGALRHCRLDKRAPKAVFRLPRYGRRRPNLKPAPEQQSLFDEWEGLRIWTGAA